MATASLSRAELLDRLLGVFRDRGFEGATLAEISHATGLGKASLYHHFPGGKYEMAEVVTREVCARLNQDVFSRLDANVHPGTAGERLGALLRGMDAYFEGGERNCLLAIMAMGTAHERLGEIIRDQYRMWVDMLGAALVEAGVGKKDGRRRARDFMARLHGAAVLARLLDDPKPFRQTLKHLQREVGNAPGD